MTSRKSFCFAAALLLAILLPAGCASHNRIVIAPAPPAAKVNGAIITEKDVEAAIDLLIPRSAFHRKVTEERRGEYRDAALENLITAELQYQDARARGLKPDSKLVQDRMDLVRARFNSESEYREGLQQARLSEELLRQRIEMYILVDKVIEETVTKPATVSESELMDHYEKNVEKFRQPEAMRLRIISTGDAARANEALARIKAGEDFGNVAATTSEDNYRIKGGDIGYVHRGRIYPELENAALSMKPGDLRGPIKAEGKWFIIRLEDAKPERQMSFEEIREKLKKELEKMRAEELLTEWTSRLRSKASIEVMTKNDSVTN